jgi:hypothetical protein
VHFEMCLHGEKISELPSVIFNGTINSYYVNQ